MVRVILAAVVALGFASQLIAAERPPNIVIVLADDLGYGDLGCYGQTKIKTPNLDKLAADGIRFITCYAGSTVCAPSRCALMTGLHTGHCRVRGNARVALRPEDACVAELLKKAGYATALVGKWGLGDDGSAGVPNKKGFDHFFGYLDQRLAHNSYPAWLWRDGEKVTLPNVESKTPGVAQTRAAYAPDLFLAEGLKFIEANKAKPFFLYYATTVPHANNERTRAEKSGNEVPSDAPYTGKPWPKPEKDKAAMITRLDSDVGKILAKLTELGLDGNTVVVFASDNGPHREGGNDPEFFDSNGPFRGIKRSLTDGGIRVPCIVRWTGVTKPGTVSDRVWAFWDFLPTACELAGVKPPGGLDGISIVPSITGKGEQRSHDFLYWEFHEGGTKQAVRYKHWKAIRPAPGAKLVLYDLKADVGEKTDVAAEHPDVVKVIEGYLKTARTESKEFPIRAPKRK
ncbi:MAG TPA: arylsulfatase [Fimbriiglobus sp.]|nr:arylsulfatase [Fimbriiglobus sp.]